MWMPWDPNMRETETGHGPQPPPDYEVLASYVRHVPAKQKVGQGWTALSDIVPAYDEYMEFRKYKNMEYDKTYERWQDNNAPLQACARPCAAVICDIHIKGIPYSDMSQYYYQNQLDALSILPNMKSYQDILSQHGRTVVPCTEFSDIRHFNSCKPIIIGEEHMVVSENQERVDCIVSVLQIEPRSTSKPRKYGQTRDTSNFLYTGCTSI
jgi:hypothetical protein